MRAIEFHGGERLELVERPDPEPGPGELLIAPEAVGICGTDVEIFEGSLAYFREGMAVYPVVPGHEWTGTVVDVGPGVDRVRARATGWWGRWRSAAASACAAAPAARTSARPAPRRASPAATARWPRGSSSRPPTRTGSTCQPARLRWSSRRRWR